MPLFSTSGSAGISFCLEWQSTVELGVIFSVCFHLTGQTVFIEWLNRLEQKKKTEFRWQLHIQAGLDASLFFLM